MKLQKIESKVNEGSRYERYELGKYIVTYSVHSYDNGSYWKNVSVTATERYLPEIYYNDLFGDEIRFTIQTTAYGSLEVEEIQKVIAGYQMAIEAVEILTKKFIG